MCVTCQGSDLGENDKENEPEGGLLPIIKEKPMKHLKIQDCELDEPPTLKKIFRINKDI